MGMMGPPVGGAADSDGLAGGAGGAMNSAMVGCGAAAAGAAGGAADGWAVVSDSAATAATTGGSAAMSASPSTASASGFALMLVVSSVNANRPKVVHTRSCGCMMRARVCLRAPFTVKFRRRLNRTSVVPVGYSDRVGGCGRDCGCRGALRTT